MLTKQTVVSPAIRALKRTWCNILCCHLSRIFFAHGSRDFSLSGNRGADIICREGWKISSSKAKYRTEDLCSPSIFHTESWSLKLSDLQGRRNSHGSLTCYYHLHILLGRLSIQRRRRIRYVSYRSVSNWVQNLGSFQLQFILRGHGDESVFRMFCLFT